MDVKRLAIWVPKYFLSDDIFSPESPLNRDDTLSPYRLLKSTMEKMGWECHTQDIYQHSNVMPDAVLFINIPRRPIASLLGDWSKNVKSYALLNECEVIVPQSWKKNRQKQFSKLFSWNDDLIDDQRVVRINFPQKLSATLAPVPFSEKKLCMLIAGNKREKHPLELYSKRIEAIRWFEKQHPAEFDLYGIGWDEYRFYWPKVLRIFNRVKPLLRYLAPVYPSYAGPVQHKRETLSRYKFSICYENAHSIPGYITEKIFDSFLAGCVPVYWGAPNISDHIPKDCFIDRELFGSYEELYDHLQGISENEYAQYVMRINDFLRSKEAFLYSEEYFATTIAQAIANDA